jgi:tetratricopeptide (TPR) repeat protein
MIALNPDQDAYKFALANLYWAQQQQAAAIDFISELLAKDPTNTENYITAAKFYISKKQFHEAEKIVQTGIEQNSLNFELHIMLGKLYLVWKKTDAAIETLKKCLVLDDDPANPGIIQAKNTLAEVYLSIRQVDNADKYVREVLEANPKSVDGHFNKGNIYLLGGDGVNAVSEFRTVVNERPQFIAAYLRLSAAHALNKEYELAEDTLHNALKVNPQSKETLKALARIYIFKKDYQSAEDQLRKIIEIDPSDARARADLGDFYMALKDTGRAGGEYVALKRDIPENPLGYLKMSKFYAKQGQPDKALEALENGYRQNPRSAGLLTALIQEYVHQKKHNEAVALCKERIQKTPGDVFSYNLLGWTYSEMQDYKMAESTLLKAIEMYPLWPAPHNNLAGVYLAQGKKNEAIEKYEATLKKNPRNAGAYLSLALLYENSREYQHAMQVYERAWKMNPNFWFAANNLAFLLSELSDNKPDYDRALGLAREALKLRPGDPAVIDTLGWVYYRLGDYEKAKSLIETALEGAPEMAILNYHMGMVLYQTGQAEQARAKLEKSLEADEDFYGRDVAEETLKKTAS